MRCTVFKYTKEQGVWAFPLHVMTHKRIYLLIFKDEDIHNSLIRAFQHLINNLTRQPLFGKKFGINCSECYEDSNSLRDYQASEEKQNQNLSTITRTQPSLSPKNRDYEQRGIFTEPNELQEAAVDHTTSPTRPRPEPIQPKGNNERSKLPTVFKIKSLSGAKYQTAISLENGRESDMNASEKRKKIAASKVEDNLLGVSSGLILWLTNLVCRWKSKKTNVEIIESKTSIRI